MSDSRQIKLELFVRHIVSLSEFETFLLKFHFFIALVQDSIEAIVFVVFYVPDQENVLKF